ncbi:MAG: hypothetical protein QNJ98_20155 [Planctomycetota bacterium]|nr:hypothetical protein [Planctomycetota bacterium]
MRRLALLIALFCAVSPRVAADEEAPVVPKGKRLLGIHVSEAEDGDFGRAYAAAKSVGTEVVGLSVAWDEMEKRPGKYASKWLPIANAFYGPEKMRVGLVLKILDTTQNRMPADLKKLPFDDPRVVKRLNALLTWMFTQIPNLELTSLSLGNEVDGVLGEDRKRWRAYTRMFNAARTHVRQSHPNLPVSVTVMYDGIVKRSTDALAQALYEQADIVLLTYYPLGKTKIRPVAHLREVFRELTTRYPKKPIHFGEIGCPSGSVLKSSLEHQRRFIAELFRVWDSYASRVPLIAYCWLTDTSPESLETYKKYYGSSDPQFVDFLATLGLRYREGGGKDKPAFTQLRTEARRRGFVPKQ